MKFALVSPPQRPAVARETVWQHLRLPLMPSAGSPPAAAPVDADYIDELISAAVAEVDGGEGLLGRALITQTWEWRRPRFQTPMLIPLPPLQSVAVRYLDPDGVLQEYSPAGYYVSDYILGQACLAPVTAWPQVKADPEAVRIEYTVGFGDDPEDVPAPIRAALLEMIATRYRFRESLSVGAGFSAIPDSARRALDNYRIWSFG